MEGPVAAAERHAIARHEPRISCFPKPIHSRLFPLYARSIDRDASTCELKGGTGAAGMGGARRKTYRWSSLITFN